MSRPRPSFVAAELALLGAAIAIGVLSAPAAHWDLGLLASLFVLSVASDFLAVRVRGRIRISGSFLALVLKSQLEERIAGLGRSGSWPEIIADLDSLTETEIEYDGKRFIVRSAPRR